MKNTLFYLLVVAVLSSCTKCESSIVPDIAAPEGKIRLTIHTARAGGAEGFIKPSNTRASSADETNMGDKAWVFVLEKLSAGSDIETLRIVENCTLQGNGDIDIILEETEHPVTVILLANAPDRYTDKNGNTKDVSLENLAHVTSYTDLTEELGTAVLSSPADKVPYVDTSIPMSGATRLDEGINKNTSANVTLERIVARISVETRLTIDQFELLGASVCNAPRSGYLLAPRENYKDNSANLTNYNYDAIACLATTLSNGNITTQTTNTNPIYIYESTPGAQTALIIKARYRGADYFYKLTMPTDYTDGNGKTLQKDFYYRNFAYKYVITDAVGIGYSTLHEACAGTPNNIEHGSITYTIDVTDLSSHDILDNGSYFIGVSNSSYIIYATGSRSNLVAFTLNTGGNTLPGGATGTIEASDGITITSGSAFTHPARDQAITISLTDNFIKGTISVKLGNLTKSIDVEREHTVAFDDRSINTFSTADYVLGEIVNVSHNSVGDWVWLSRIATGLNSRVRYVVNSDGGIYIHLDINWDKNQGSPGRNATLYLSRKTGAGRVKVYLEQDYNDSSI